MLPIIRYPLDPTGTNSDNRINGEVHTLNARPIRAIAPTFGPFFSESLQVFDDTLNIPLILGQDYKITELLQEASLKFGKEISSLILIINPNVSQVVRINYQVLGDKYQNNISNLVNIYEAFLADDRGVDWVNVLNKPDFYPPSLHNHLLTDIYGFEPLVVALERIRNALVLSDIPVFEQLIDYVVSKTAVVDEQTIIDSSNSSKLLTWDRLLFALNQLNFNAITLTPSSGNVSQGDVVIIQVSTTNIPDNTQLFWTIENINTLQNDFYGSSGIINIVGNRGQFNIPIAINTQAEPDEQFRVLIHKNSVTGAVIAQTSLFTIGAHAGYDYPRMLMNCCVYNPKIPINPVSAFLLDSY